MCATNYYPLVSVIVPVYNVEDYLERCVSSITDQTYDNLEIILVDDGSTDSSGKLCDELGVQDGRITVIHSENHGLSGARNLGLRNIHGEWIVYVDSDDFIGPNHIFNLLSTAIGAGVQMAVTGPTLIYDDQNFFIDTSTASPTSYSTIPFEEASCIAIESISRPFAEHAWGKIYASTLIPYLSFPEGRLWEDQFIMYQIIYAAQAIAYENANDYYYSKQRTSSLSQIRDKGFLDTLEARQRILEFARSKQLTKLEATTTKKYYSVLIGRFAALSLCGQNQLANFVYQSILAERSPALRSPYTALTTKVAMILSFLPRKLFVSMLRLTERCIIQR